MNTLKTLLLLIFFSSHCLAQTNFQSDLLSGDKAPADSVVSKYINGIAVVKKFKECTPNIVMDVSSEEAQKEDKTKYFCASYNFRTKEGKIISPVWFSELYGFGKDRIRVRATDYKFGYADQYGKLVIPCIYSDAEDFTGNTALVMENGKWHWINKQGLKNQAEEFDKMNKWKNDFYIITRNDSSGIYTAQGQQIIPIVYSTLVPYMDSVILVKKNSKAGIINLKNKIVVPFNYNRIIPLLTISKWDRYFNRKEKNYGADDFRKSKQGNLLFMAEADSGLTIIDNHGQLLSSWYDEIEPVRQGYFLVKKNRYWGLLDSTFREVIPVMYKEIEPLDSKWTDRDDKEIRYFVVRSDREMEYLGLFTVNGKKILDPVYLTIEKFNKKGYAAVDKITGRSKYSSGYETIGFLIDSLGTKISPEYRFMHPFNEGMAVVSNGGTGYGYIDEEGKLVIPFTYTIAHEFSDGLAAVSLKGKYGYIDKTGKIVLPLQYDYANEFSRGKAKVTLNGKEIRIDKEGKEIE